LIYTVWPILEIKGLEVYFKKVNLVKRIIIGEKYNIWYLGRKIKIPIK
jgi:hypothetical protein